MLTQPQRKLLWIASVAVAGTRLFAMATSPWDWDEIQFMAAVREYDVGQHHPHPAGFPLYILLGKAVKLLGADDFRSLQVVALLAACSLFPLLRLLASELGFGFRTSMLAALLFSFFPNIWYFGGTVFSDVTGVAINLAAMAALVGGRRSAVGGGSPAYRQPPTCSADTLVSAGADRSVCATLQERPARFLLGCALTGAALAVRPHSGFILLVPLLYAMWHQRSAWRRIIGGVAITMAIVAVSYGGAALASESASVFIDRVRYFQRWVHDTDSIANPGRGSLRDLAMSFLVWPMGAGRLSLIVTALSALALALGQRHRGVWLTFAAFAPYMFFAWLMLDPVGFRRYSTAYVAVYALLAAYTLERLTVPFGRAAAIAHVLAVVVVLARYVAWAYPAIAEMRMTIAPTHAASVYAQSVVPRGGRVWVDDSMNPWARYYLADRTVMQVSTPGDLPLGAREQFLTEGKLEEEGARVFVRGRGRIAEIHPQRHFEASVAPAPIVWRFGAGWSDPEGHLSRNWRWMSARSVAMVPSKPGRARLRLVLAPPAGIASDIEVRVNGTVIDRFALGAMAEKEWTIEDGREMNRLEIASSVTVNPRETGRGGDDRDLALRLFDYGWYGLP